MSLWIGHLLLQPQSGEAPGSGKRQATHVTISLVSEQEALVPGQTAWLGLDMQIEKGWHTYWPGLNDTGTPISLEIKGPEGFRVGEIVWPAPRRLAAPGNELDHVYEARVLLMVPVEVPKDAKPGKVTFTADAKWLVCSALCLAEQGAAALDIPVVAPGEKPNPSPAAALFTQARKRVPTPLKPDSPAKARVDGRTLVVEAPGAGHLSFLAADGSTPMPRLFKQGESSQGKLTIDLEPDSKDAKPYVKGIIEVQTKGEKEPAFYSVNLPVAATPQSK
jgi:DsbC/DsbD-like thiol-disulfide interchange protein